MKHLRSVAVVLAFGFVAFQLFTLNSKIVEEASMGSALEVYKVSSDGRLSLRRGPSRNAEIILKLDGKNSGDPAKVILVSKDLDEWWLVQLTDEDEKVIQGYVFAEFLELTESAEPGSEARDQTTSLD